MQYLVLRGYCKVSSHKQKKPPQTRWFFVYLTIIIELLFCRGYCAVCQAAFDCTIVVTPAFNYDFLSFRIAKVAVVVFSNGVGGLLSVFVNCA